MERPKHSEETKRKISTTLMGHSVSQRTRKKLSLANIGRKQSRESKKKTTEGLKRYYRSKEGLEMRKFISKQSKRNWEDENFRKKCGSTLKNTWKDRTQMLKNLKKAWTPERRKIYSEKFKGTKSPWYGKKHTRKTKNQMRKSHLGKSAVWNLGDRNGMKSEKARLKSSRTHRKLWQNKNYRDQQLKKMSMGILASPNRFEIRALAFLNNLFKGAFKFCGDRSIFINGRSPDAIHRAKKIICLFNGVYWHLKYRGFAITDHNKRICERKEARPFLDAGYRVIFIWEDELGRIIKQESATDSQKKEVLVCL